MKTHLIKAGVVLMAAVGFASAAVAADATMPSKVMLTDDLTVEKPLTGVAGDAAAGREWFSNRKLGNCLACHMNVDLASEPFHGEVGPTLDGAGDRWEPAELRAIIVNPKKVFGDQTIMPAFYRDGGGVRISKKFQGKTILTAQQVEDIIAYVSTLKE